MSSDSDSFSLPDAGPAGGDIAARWEKARKSFMSSIMVETSLSSLAQNLDGADWPLKGAAETPSKYVELTYDELLELPGLSGHPERIEHLVTILQETLAFDEPFGDMVSQRSMAEERDNPILKNLAKLEIPEDFPITLVALTQETRDYCVLESLSTLKDFAMFAQNISQTVIVGGDFRSFLNAISHIDEAALSQFLPFRPGTKGVHLMEGLALTARGYSTDIQAALARKYGARLGEIDAAGAARAPREEVTAAEDILSRQAAGYVDYFRDDFAILQQEIDDGIPLGRLASELKNPLVESVVTGLLKPYLRVPSANTPSRTTTPPHSEEVPRAKKKGLFAALGRLFKN